MAVSDWSTTPSSNNAAPPNGWPENQAPSSLNDTGRQMMADIRAFYDNAALKDAANVFTSATGANSYPVRLSGSFPALGFIETDAAANNKAWDFLVNLEQLDARVANDAGDTVASWLTVTRTGTTVDSINLQATAVRVNGTAIWTADNDGSGSGLDADLVKGAVVTSGTYTPTLTTVANVSASTARQCQYIRVGSVVTVSGSFNLTATAATTSTTIGMSLPIASDIAQQWNLGGSGSTRLTTSDAPLGILGDATNNRASIDWVSPAGSAGSALEYGFTFTYLVA